MSNRNVIPEAASSKGEWYSQKGAASDVVLSTRVRLARNLADFPFPNKFKNDDSLRVQGLVFNSFLKSDQADSYQTLAVASLEHLGAQMLLERGLIEQSALNSPGAGIVMRINGSKANSGLVTTINDRDHVRIACFVAGLNCEKAYECCHEIDEELQKSLQFAASYDFGYLTSMVKDSGSGMKISARVHLPSTAFLNEIGPLFDSLQSKGIMPEPAFGSAINAGVSIGSYYQLSSNISGNGSEMEQLAGFTSILRSVVEGERKRRDIVLQKKFTEVTDRVLKSFSTAKFGILFDLREAIQIVSDIKWGKSLDIVKGIEDSELSALLYRIQEAHLQSVIKSEAYKFPMDIASDEKKKAAWLRALVLMDTFEHIKISQ